MESCQLSTVPAGPLQAHRLPLALPQPLPSWDPQGFLNPDGGTSWPQDPLKIPPTGPIPQHPLPLPPLSSNLLNPSQQRGSLSSPAPAPPCFCSPNPPSILAGCQDTSDRILPCFKACSSCPEPTDHTPAPREPLPHPSHPTSAQLSTDSLEGLSVPFPAGTQVWPLLQSLSCCCPSCVSLHAHTSLVCLSLPLAQAALESLGLLGTCSIATSHV